MPTRIVRFFWNYKEKRLRTTWRLAGFSCLLLILCTPPLFAIGFWIALQAIQNDQISSTGLDSAILTENLINSDLYLILTIFFLIITIIAILVSAHLLDHRSFSDYGLHINKEWWLDLGFGLVLGATLMTVIFIIELAAGWVTITDFMYRARPANSFMINILYPVLLFLSVGMYEELLARGYLLKNLAEGLNLPAIGSKNALFLAWFISSIVFGLVHLTNPGASFGSTMNLILAGLFLGLGTILTGELAIPIGLHITWNFFQSSVFGFPVSGISPGATIISTSQRGPEFMTGGAFGPEAGLMGVGAIILGSLAIIQWLRWRYGKVEIDSKLAQYNS
ncbi:MAG: CPBP family intramembrane metalloprotease [Anaerolineales bacterium]|nr:CPBP family intramembrane metalloprotease [Anaerolineales bacterium]